MQTILIDHSEAVLWGGEDMYLQPVQEHWLPIHSVTCKLQAHNSVSLTHCILYMYTSLRLRLCLLCGSANRITSVKRNPWSSVVGRPLLSMRRRDPL